MEDMTHFPIEIYFEENAKVVMVPNPQVLRKRCCALWPYEVKQALGFLGNMQVGQQCFVCWYCAAM